MAVNQVDLEDKYEEGFNSLPELEKTAFYECLSVDRAERYAKAVGEVLIESPNFWELEVKGFKKVSDPSAQITYNIIEGMLESQDVELSYYPDVSSLSRAYSSLSKIAGDEFEEVTTSKTGSNCGKNRNYSAKSFSQKHWNALQKILE